MRRAILIVSAALATLQVAFPPWQAEATVLNVRGDEIRDIRQDLALALRGVNVEYRIDTTTDVRSWSVPAWTLFSPPEWNLDAYRPRELTSALSSPSSVPFERMMALFELESDRKAALQAKLRIPEGLRSEEAKTDSSTVPHRWHRTELRIHFSIDLPRLLLQLLLTALVGGIAWLLVIPRHRSAIK